MVPVGDWQKKTLLARARLALPGPARNGATGMTSLVHVAAGSPVGLYADIAYRGVRVLDWSSRNTCGRSAAASGAADQAQNTTVSTVAASKAAQPVLATPSTQSPPEACVKRRRKLLVARQGGA